MAWLIINEVWGVGGLKLSAIRVTVILATVSIKVETGMKPQKWLWGSPTHEALLRLNNTMRIPPPKYLMVKGFTLNASTGIAHEYVVTMLGTQYLWSRHPHIILVWLTGSLKKIRGLVTSPHKTHLIPHKFGFVAIHWDVQVSIGESPDMQRHQITNWYISRSHLEQQSISLLVWRTMFVTVILQLPTQKFLNGNTTQASAFPLILV